MNDVYISDFGLLVVTDCHGNPPPDDFDDTEDGWSEVEYGPYDAANRSLVASTKWLESL